MTIHEIQAIVCRDYGVSLLDLTSRRRDRAIIPPRQLAMWLCRHTTPSSLPEIGRAFGKRDHTTVMHAMQRIEARLAADRMFAIRVLRLRRTVESGETAGRRAVA